jgi:hypothetical protein
MFGWTLALLLLAPFARRARVLDFLLPFSACLMGLSLEPFHFPHYAVLSRLRWHFSPPVRRRNHGAAGLDLFRFGAFLTCLVFAVAWLIPLRAALLFGWNGGNTIRTFPRRGSG